MHTDTSHITHIRLIAKFHIRNNAHYANYGPKN